MVNLDDIINKMTRDVKARCVERLKRAKVITDKPLYEEYGISNIMKKETRVVGIFIYR